MKKIWIALAAAGFLCQAAFASEATVQANIAGVSSVVEAGGILFATDTQQGGLWRIQNGGAERQTVIEAGGSGGRIPASFGEAWSAAPFLNGWAVTSSQLNTVLYYDGSQIQTAAGSGKAGMADGVGEKASFNRPTGLASGANGELYIADTGNDVIRKLDADGNVTVFARGFREPTGLFYENGTLFVADTGNHRVCAVRDGQVTALAGGRTQFGAAGEEGFSDGFVSNALFCSPQGVAVGPDSAVYVADTGNGAVRKIENGLVSTFVMPAGAEESWPVFPRGLSFKGQELFVCDPFSNVVFSVALEKVQFTDVPEDAWYQEAVKTVSELGVMAGNNAEFLPEEPLSRAMLAATLYRTEQAKHRDRILTGAARFPDVDTGAWFAPAVGWAAEHGVILGADSGEFRPFSQVNRQEFAVMLYRLSGSPALPADSTLSDWQDAGSVAPWAAEAVGWAVSQQLLQGSGGKLSPLDTVTRAQAAQILARFLALS